MGPISFCGAEGNRRSRSSTPNAAHCVHGWVQITHALRNEIGPTMWALFHFVELRGTVAHAPPHPTPRTGWIQMVVATP
mgnify:CR=1 FL=1